MQNTYIFYLRKFILLLINQDAIIFLFMNQQMDKTSTINLDIYLGQVSGKQPKLLSQDHTKILKGFNQQEYEFYKLINSYHISHPYSAILTYIPTWHGVFQLKAQPDIKISGQNEKSTMAWLSHLAGRYRYRNQSNKFLVLSNLTYGWELPNVFDIKIGGRKMTGKMHKITRSVQQFKIKLNGVKINFVQGGPSSLFLSKYFLVNVVEMPDIISYFELFFFNGQVLLLQTVITLVSKLKDLILCFKSLKGFKFISSSICILYDAKKPQRLDIKFIDFGRVGYMHPGFVDEETLQGMQSILNILLKVIETGDKNIQKLKEQRKYLSQANINVVPDRKFVKYGDKQRKDSD